MTTREPKLYIFGAAYTDGRRGIIIDTPCGPVDVRIAAYSKSELDKLSPMQLKEFTFRYGPDGNISHVQGTDGKFYEIKLVSVKKK